MSKLVRLYLRLPCRHRTMNDSLRILYLIFVFFKGRRFLTLNSCIEDRNLTILHFTSVR